MKHFKAAYEQRLWIDGHGYSTSRHFQDIYAKDMDHAQGKWSVMQLDNQSLLFIIDLQSDDKCDQTNEQERKFRQWARDNYIPFTPINRCWHSVITEECQIINATTQTPDIGTLD